MASRDPGLIKQREVLFCTLHPDPQQAHAAAGVLEGREGILSLHVPDPYLLQVRYDLLRLSLIEIEELLNARGFHLDGSLMNKLLRSLYHYTEANERQNLGCTQGDSNCTTKVFISSYQRREHGCRDERPSHWRRYL